MGVIRYRHDNDMRYGYANGDLGRIETQQAFLKAVVEQCLQIQNVARINELAKVFTENVSTDLTINNLAWFAQEAIFGGLRMENVNFHTMPNEGHMVWSRSYHSYQSYVTPVEDELVELVNECFNPYREDLDTNELDIMSVDENGKLHSTTGRVEDTKANSSGGGSTSGSQGSGGRTEPSGRPPPRRSRCRLRVRRPPPCRSPRRLKVGRSPPLRAALLHLLRSRSSLLCPPALRLRRPRPPRRSPPPQLPPRRRSLLRRAEERSSFRRKQWLNSMRKENRL